MSLDTICLLNENGRDVFARKGQLIAFGQDAVDFIAPSGGVEDRPRCELDPESEPAFLVEEIDLERQQRILDDARENGHRVQPNHVMLFHCGSCCDPCCDMHPSIRHRFTDEPPGEPQADDGPHRANPLSANPLSANPLSANPLSANPIRTSAVPSGDQGVKPETAPPGGGGPSIYIIDSGLGSPAHPWLLTVDGDRDDVIDASPLDSYVDAVAGHGTFIAGIVEGLAPGCEVRVVRPDAAGYSGEGEVDEYSVATELFAHEAHARTIINLSFGGPFYEQESLLREAIAAKQAQGAVIVASAGNDASCEPNYPAAFPGVIAVGALDTDGAPAAFTNYGSWVNACAVGVDWVSTFLTPDNVGELAAAPETDSDILGFRDGWAVWSGTSFAAPAVVAMIALKMQQRNPVISAKLAAAAVLAEGIPVGCLGRQIVVTSRAQYVEPDGPNS